MDFPTIFHMLFNIYDPATMASTVFLFKLWLSVCWCCFNKLSLKCENGEINALNVCCTYFLRDNQLSFMCFSPKWTIAL